MKYWIIITTSLLGWRAEAQQVGLSPDERLLQAEMRIFSASSDSARLYWMIEKSDIHQVNGNFTMALQELERAGKLFPGKAVPEWKYKMMLNYFLAGRFGYSADIILGREELRTLGKEREYFMMRFFSLSQTEDWSKCRLEMAAYCSDTAKARAIMMLPEEYNYTDPEKCRRLSSIVPGAGMVKSGKLFKAGTSLVLQAGFAFFGGYALYTGYYATGIVTGVLPLMKFHIGGNRLSAILAEEKNEREKARLKALYADEIKKILRP